MYSGYRGHGAAARKTAAGFLLLQFGKGTEPAKVEKIKNKIAVAMGEDASVFKVAKNITVQINDINPIITKEEVQETLVKAIPGEDCKIPPLRTGFGGMQRTVITLCDTLLTRKFVNGGKLKVGFVSCRIKLLPTVLRCFRCHNLGHSAARCTVGKEIKEVCRKCGDINHNINECKKTARCVLCAKNGAPRTGWIK